MGNNLGHPVPMLAGLLDPLENNAELLRTLERYVALDLDRRRTAADLHVHPNTLDYRLRRVEALTGLKLSKAPHTVLICLALMQASAA